MWGWEGGDGHQAGGVMGWFWADGSLLVRIGVVGLHGGAMIVMLDGLLGRCGGEVEDLVGVYKLQVITFLRIVFLFRQKV